MVLSLKDTNHNTPDAGIELSSTALAQCSTGVSLESSSLTDLQADGLPMFSLSSFDHSVSEKHIPDLDELLATFSNLDPRKESFSLSSDSLAEDWFAEAPCADIYKMRAQFIADGGAEENENSFFSNTTEIVQCADVKESFFPEPEPEISDDERPSVFFLKRRARKRMSRLVTTVVFFTLCAVMLLSAGFLVFSKVSEGVSYNKYTYTVQSPTMSPSTQRTPSRNCLFPLLFF